MVLSMIFKVVKDARRMVREAESGAIELERRLYSIMEPISVQAESSAN